MPAKFQGKRVFFYLTMRGSTMVGILRTRENLKTKESLENPRKTCVLTRHIGIQTASVFRRELNEYMAEISDNLFYAWVYESCYFESYVTKDEIRRIARLRTNQVVVSMDFYK